MSNRMKEIAQSLDPHARDFRAQALASRFLRSRMQRPHTRSLAGWVEMGLSGSVSSVTRGLQHLSQMGEARRA